MKTTTLTLSHRIQVILVPRLVDERAQFALRILEQHLGGVEFDLYVTI
jgi:hypothetical protein